MLECNFQVKLFSWQILTFTFNYFTNCKAKESQGVCFQKILSYFYACMGLVIKKYLFLSYQVGEKHLTRSLQNDFFCQKLLESTIYVLIKQIQNIFLVFKWSFCFLCVVSFFCSKNNNQYRYALYFSYSWCLSHRVTTRVENTWKVLIKPSAGWSEKTSHLAGKTEINIKHINK